jgi:hypothetical protein
MYTKWSFYNKTTHGSGQLDTPLITDIAIPLSNYQNLYTSAFSSINNSKTTNVVKDNNDTLLLINDSLRICLIMPESLKIEILSACYGDIYSGYFGIKIIFDRLQLPYFYSAKFQIHPVSWQVVLSAVLRNDLLGLGRRPFTHFLWSMYIKDEFRKKFQHLNCDNIYILIYNLYTILF